MITIDQLLESVDLDFEPRFVTKQKDGLVMIWSARPKILTATSSWENDFCERLNGSFLKLSEFDGKDWTECIYEVPRKEELKDKIKIGTLYIDKSVTFGDGDDDDVGVALEDYEVPRKTTGKIEKLERHIRVENGYEISCPPEESEIIEKINLLIDVVNELKGAKNE